VVNVNTEQQSSVSIIFT